jgi:hypothetical protein
MFECHIIVFLPVRLIGDEERYYSTVAKYDFDPGLQHGDSIRINNAPFITRTRDDVPIKSERTFSFDAQILHRRRYINCDVPADKFILAIEIEIADKEVIPEIVDYFQETFPGQYERYPIEPDSD